jgi:hypothetical protein
MATGFPRQDDLRHFQVDGSLHSGLVRFWMWSQSAPMVPSIYSSVDRGFGINFSEFLEVAEHFV